MKTNKIFATAIVAFGLLVGTSSFAQMKERTVEVGGAPMYPSKNIVENAVNSKDHTTLVAAVKAAGLVDVLMSEGPFTVFAPTNAAFAKLPAGTVETLLKPENLKLTLKTVSGGTLTAWMKGKVLYITDENGNSAKVTIADVNQKNGVIHVVDTVVTPKS